MIVGIDGGDDGLFILFVWRWVECCLRWFGYEHSLEAKRLRWPKLLFCLRSCWYCGVEISHFLFLVSPRDWFTRAFSPIGRTSRWVCWGLDAYLFRVLKAFCPSKQRPRNMAVRAYKGTWRRAALDLLEENLLLCRSIISKVRKGTEGSSCANGL